jgi:hypothetical protein
MTCLCLSILVASFRCLGFGRRVSTLLEKLYIIHALDIQACRDRTKRGYDDPGLVGYLSHGDKHSLVLISSSRLTYLNLSSFFSRFLSAMNSEPYSVIRSTLNSDANRSRNMITDGPVWVITNALPRCSLASPGTDVGSAVCCSVTHALVCGSPSNIFLTA